MTDGAGAGDPVDLSWVVPPGGPGGIALPASTWQRSEDHDESSHSLVVDDRAQQAERWRGIRAKPPTSHLPGYDAGDNGAVV